jgi:excisionase family DNA binding protein
VFRSAVEWWKNAPLRSENPPPVHQSAPIWVKSNETDTVARMSQSLRWLSTKEASARLGITLRTLYRLIDEGQVPAYKFGRVIRLKEAEVDAFIESARVEPGNLTHLYPESKTDSKEEKVSAGAVSE